MDYRLGTEEDIDEICELINQAIVLMENQGIHQWDELYPERIDFEQDVESKTLYVVHDEGKLVATYAISQECDEEYQMCSWENPDETAYILHRFCVSPECQNKGIGRTVLGIIEKQIKEMGYSSVRLDVFSENPYALRLYKGNGYIKRGHADWRKGRFFLMEKKIV